MRALHCFEWYVFIWITVLERRSNKEMIMCCVGSIEGAKRKERFQTCSPALLCYPESHYYFTKCILLELMLKANPCQVSYRASGVPLKVWRETGCFPMTRFTILFLANPTYISICQAGDETAQAVYYWYYYWEGQGLEIGFHLCQLLIAHISRRKWSISIKLH